MGLRVNEISVGQKDVRVHFKESEAIRYRRSRCLVKDNEVEERTRMRIVLTLWIVADMMKQISGKEPRIDQTTSNQGTAAWVAHGSSSLWSSPVPVRLKCSYSMVIHANCRDTDTLTHQ